MSGAQGPELSRRRLMLAGAGAASAVAAATTIAPAVRDAPAEPVASSAPPDQPGGYRLTQHVLRYYQTARV